MTDLNISLPESMYSFVEEQIATGSCRTASEYFQALIREDQQRKAQARLESLLIEGLESGPATTMTDADWDEMRRRFDERHRGAKGA
jgi:antitoxin ParD1/3/4